MSFWKKQKSKLLIGGALLVIATGALGILKREETRLQREIVGCERVIDRETRDEGVPPEPERWNKLRQAIQNREELQEQQQELKVSEEELTELIKRIKDLEIELSQERRTDPKNWTAIGLDKYKEKVEVGLNALSIFSKFSDKQARRWYDCRNNMDKLYNEGSLKEFENLFPTDLFDEFYAEFYDSSVARIPNKTYEGVLYQVYNQVLFFLDLSIEAVEKMKDRLLELSNEINKQLIRLTKTEELREKLKEYTEKMNDLNARVSEYLDELEEVLNYLNNSKSQLEQEMGRKGIRILAPQ